MRHVIARIGKPHGIRGEVTVQLHTDNPLGRFAVGTVLPTSAAGRSGVPHSLTVRSARDHNGTWLLAFDEVPDRARAEGLRGTRLLTPVAVAGSGSTVAGGTLGADAAAPGGSETGDPLVPSPTDEWYAEELEGLSVTLPDGSRVGTVSGLEIRPGQDRLVVALADGGTAYVPFVKALVPVVDVPGRRVVIDPPPGLLELG